MLVLLIGALIAPAAVLFAVWHNTEEKDIAKVEPATFIPDALARTVSVTATASLTWQAPATVPAPSWSGLTTAVLVHEGDNLVDGMPVARIDGTEVRYYVLGSPLFQPVCAGESVLLPEVRHILETTGLPVGTGSSRSQTDINSIREYAAEIGVPNATSASCFDPGWVLSSESPLATIAEVGLSVGVPAPAQGEAVLTGEPILARVTVRGNTGAAEIDEHLDAAGASVFADSDIYVGGTPTGVTLIALEDPAALATLAARLSPEEVTTTVAVNLTLKKTQFVVPATSVIDATGPQPCMESALDGNSVPVSVVASSVGGLVVDLGGADASDPILATPELSTCG